MKQTLKVTAAVIGIVAAGLLFGVAIRMPLTDCTVEALTAITAISAVIIIIMLCGYIFTILTSKHNR